MKKNLIIIILSIILLIIVFQNQLYLSNSIIITSYLFISKILPFFIPMFIISKILINYNFPYYFSKLFNNNIYVYILTISFLVGCPSNIILLKDLINKNIITSDEANIYIRCSFFNNPLFLYSILNTIFNKNIAIFIIIIEILSNIIIYLIKPVKNNNITMINQNSFINTIINSIEDMIKPLEIIYITILLFNIIIIILPNYLNNFIGILELTNGLNYLINLNMNINYKLFLAIIYISFGGLSIHIQVKYIINNKIKYSSFFIGRIFQIIISLLLTFCYLRIISCY